MIKKRDEVWQAGVRRKGYPSQFASFPTYQEAKDWADEVELKIRQGARVDHRVLRATTVRDLLLRYDLEVCAENGDNGKKDSARINAFLRERWTLLALDQDITAALRDWGKKRLREVQPQTHNRDLNLLSAIFSYAIKTWGVRFIHPIKGQLSRPAGSGGVHRDFTWSDDDVQAALEYLKFDPTKKPVMVQDFLPWVIVLARHIGLRDGQLCSTELSWVHLENEKAAWIDYPGSVTKNGLRHAQPLSSRALPFVKQLAAHRAGEDKLLGITSKTAGMYWRHAREELAKTRPGMAELRLHDLRHTWTTEMVDVRKVPKEQLMKISNRLSDKELMRYYNPSVETLAPLMG